MGEVLRDVGGENKKRAPQLGWGEKGGRLSLKAKLSWGGG